MSVESMTPEEKLEIAHSFNADPEKGVADLKTYLRGKKIPERDLEAKVVDFLFNERKTLLNPTPLREYLENNPYLFERYAKKIELKQKEFLPALREYRSELAFNPSKNFSLNMNEAFGKLYADGGQNMNPPMSAKEAEILGLSTTTLNPKTSKEKSKMKGALIDQAEGSLMNVSVPLKEGNNYGLKQKDEEVPGAFNKRRAAAARKEFLTNVYKDVKHEPITGREPIFNTRFVIKGGVDIYTLNSGITTAKRLGEDNGSSILVQQGSYKDTLTNGYIESQVTTIFAVGVSGRKDESLEIQRVFCNSSGQVPNYTMVVIQGGGRLPSKEIMEEAAKLTKQLAELQGPNKTCDVVTSNLEARAAMEEIGTAAGLEVAALQKIEAPAAAVKKQSSVSDEKMAELEAELKARVAAGKAGGVKPLDLATPPVTAETSLDLPTPSNSRRPSSVSALAEPDAAQAAPTPAASKAGPTPPPRPPKPALPKDVQAKLEAVRKQAAAGQVSTSTTTTNKAGTREKPTPPPRRTAAGVGPAG